MELQELLDMVKTQFVEVNWLSVETLKVDDCTFVG